MPDTKDAQQEILKSSSVFLAVDKVQHSEFAKLFEHRPYKGDDLVFREGDRGDGLYVIADGVVKLTKALPSGGKAVICQLGEGQTLGEMALISQSPRTTEAIFVSTGAMFVLSREKFNALEKVDVSLFSQIIKSLASLVCERLNTMNSEVATFLQELETLRDDAKALEQQKSGLLARLFGG